jgi:hypothetical protein
VTLKILVVDNQRHRVLLQPIQPAKLFQTTVYIRWVCITEPPLNTAHHDIARKFISREAKQPEAIQELLDLVARRTAQTLKRHQPRSHSNTLD